MLYALSPVLTLCSDPAPIGRTRQFFSTFGNRESAAYHYDGGVGYTKPRAALTFTLGGVPNDAHVPTLNLSSYQPPPLLSAATGAGGGAVGGAAGGGLNVGGSDPLDAAPDCTYINFMGNRVGAQSSRMMCYGFEYYGTFTRAWFTLFQVLTGESWSEVIAVSYTHLTLPTKA